MTAVNRSNPDSPSMQLRVAGVCLDAASMSTVQESIRAWPTVKFTGNLAQYFIEKHDFTLVQRFAEPQPDVVLVDFDQDRQRAATTAEHLRDLFEGRVAIFAVSSQSDPNLIIGAMRSGCSEYLSKPLAPSVFSEALSKLEVKKKERERTHRRGRILTLLGAKGGAGVTTIAVHLATFLATLSQKKTLLIDQHSDLGDAALYLGIEKHLYNFYELANNVYRIDTNLVDGFLVHHETGLDLLASPDTLHTSVVAAAKDVETTLDFLKTMYEYTVIDCPPGLSGLNLAAVEKSDELWLIATPDVPSVRNLSRYLEHLMRFNYPAEHIKVVINRQSRKDPVSKDDIGRALKRPVSMTLPNSYAEVMQAVNGGSPISPHARSEFAGALKRIVDDSLRGIPPPAAAQQEPKRRFGILGR